MRISTVGPLPPAPHDYMPHAKAFGNNIIKSDLLCDTPGVRNGEKSHTRFGIFKDSFKIQGFARDSAGFTKNYGDSAIRSRFSKRFRDSAKDSGIQEGIHSRFRDSELI